MKYLLIQLLILPSAFAISWESGSKQVNLVELFTSESCSSCPPAERWLNQLKDNPKTFQTIVPVEFHVDYWNHLSWKDKFSKREYTQRQRQYAYKRDTNVFTPQLLLNGQRDIRYSSPHPTVNKNEAPNLKVEFNTKKGELTLTTDYKGEYICEAALLGGGHVTKVKSGENEGRTLAHEFVVSKLLKSSAKDQLCQFKFKEARLNRHSAIAVWIRSSKTYRVIQATGRFLNGT